MWLHSIPLTYAVHCTIWINGVIVFKYTAHRWKHPNLWGNGFPKFVHTFYHQSSLGDKVQIYHTLYHPNLQGKDVTKVAHKIYHPMSQGDKAHTLSYVNLQAMRSCKHTVTITVRTPYIMQSWLVGQALLFSFNLLNLATPLLSYVVHLVLLSFVLLSSLPCNLYDAVLILTLGYPLFTNMYIS